MKTIEQKDKAYDEAFKIAKKNYDAAQDLCDGSQIGIECFKNTLVNIFPELKESEDEKIRKALIKILQEIVIDTNYKELGIDYNIRDMIAWIEKQNKTLDPDKVIEWLENQACQGWIEDVEVEKFVDKFKKDFGL